jgi:hypothetical protein
MVSSRLDIVAHHEAGHAVVAWMLGLKVEYVNILDGGAGAHTESATYLARDLDNETYLAAISKDIIVALAGSYAQQRYRPQSAKRQPAEWEETDRLLQHRWDAVQRSLRAASSETRSTWRC